MRRIELPEDYAQPARVTVGQTLLRVALGGLLIYHALQRLQTFDAFQDELAMRFALLEPATVAQLVLGLQFAAGAGLIFGWFTRLSALALLGSVGLWVTLEVLRQNGEWRLEAFELPAVLVVSALFFLLAGPGPASFHEWLRARARRKAIQNDATWQRHPYVSGPAHHEHSYERSYDEAYRRSRQPTDYDQEDSGQAYDERQPYDEGRSERADRERPYDDEEPRNRYAGSRRR